MVDISHPELARVCAPAVTSPATKLRGWHIKPAALFSPIGARDGAQRTGPVFSIATMPHCPMSQCFICLRAIPTSRGLYVLGPTNASATLSAANGLSAT